jgi:hypothetical protein
VLRLEEGGGFVPMGFLVTQAPQFTLYGAGTVIFKQLDTRMGMPAGVQAMLPFLTVQLDEPAVQELLRFALETGHLATAGDHYDNSMVADAPTTLFTVHAGGVQKVVSVYALGIEANPGPEAADREAFSLLARRLVNFQQEPGLGSTTAYDPSFYRLTLMAGGEPVITPLDWPWADVRPADFQAGTVTSRLEAILDRDHVAKLLAVPNGGHAGVWVTAPDGSVVQVGVRPLLPDEVPQPTG